jgi:transcriptional regulator with XRE-family HTH domain
MIPQTIKTLRKNHELSQAQLARRLGVTRSSVNAWEMGASVPSIQTIVQLSDFFKVSSDFLLGIPHNRSISVDGLAPDEISILLRLISYFRSRRPA